MGHGAFLSNGKRWPECPYSFFDLHTRRVEFCCQIVVKHVEQRRTRAKRTKRYVQRIRDRSKKAGQAPESLVSAPGAPGTVLIRVVHYDARTFNEAEVQSIEACGAYAKTPWLTNTVFLTLENQNTSC